MRLAEMQGRSLQLRDSAGLDRFAGGGRVSVLLVGFAFWLSTLREMMRDLFPFPLGQRRIQDCVDGEVLLAPVDPGSHVVEAYHDREAERGRVHARLQRLAVHKVYIQGARCDGRPGAALHLRERRLGAATVSVFARCGRASNEYPKRLHQAACSITTGASVSASVI
jgi:hypothetical protein